MHMARCEHRSRSGTGAGRTEKEEVCVWTQWKKKKKNSRGPQSVTTEGAPSILFNRDHVLGAVPLSFYLYVCTYVANPHDSHFPSLWVCLLLTFICDSSISAHWAFTVVWDAQRGAKTCMLHWTGRFSAFWFHSSCKCVHLSLYLMLWFLHFGGLCMCVCECVSVWFCHLKWLHYSAEALSSVKCKKTVMCFMKQSRTLWSCPPSPRPAFCLWKTLAKK